MNFDDQIAVRTLYGECRGEGEDEQTAIAHTLLNRLISGKWGHTLAQVCLAHAQYSCWLQSDPNYVIIITVDENNLILQKLGKILWRAKFVNSPDPTNGATHYFATSISDPYWVKDATYCGQIGKTKFYKDVK